MEDKRVVSFQTDAELYEILTQRAIKAGYITRHGRPNVSEVVRQLVRRGLEQEPKPGPSLTQRVQDNRIPAGMRTQRG